MITIKQRLLKTKQNLEKLINRGPTSTKRVLDHNFDMTVVNETANRKSKLMTQKAMRYQFPRKKSDSDDSIVRIALSLTIIVFVMFHFIFSHS